MPDGVTVRRRSPVRFADLISRHILFGRPGSRLTLRSSRTARPRRAGCWRAWHQIWSRSSATAGVGNSPHASIVPTSIRANLHFLLLYWYPFPSRSASALLGWSWSSSHALESTSHGSNTEKVAAIAALR